MRLVLFTLYPSICLNRLCLQEQHVHFLSPRLSQGLQQQPSPPACRSSQLKAAKLQSSFRVAVISDEISQDFDHACSVIANDFGLSGSSCAECGTRTSSTSTMRRSPKPTPSSTNTSCASPTSPARSSKSIGPARPSPNTVPGKTPSARTSLSRQQDEVLEKSIALAKQFKTERVRCFDFWRLDDQAPYREAINAKLLEAANTAGKHNLLLVLENECRMQHRHRPRIRQDPRRRPVSASQAQLGPRQRRSPRRTRRLSRRLCSTAQGSHRPLPRQMRRNQTQHQGWLRMGRSRSGPARLGEQFRALKQAGYRDAVSLETHWRGAGTPEASTRISWAGMKAALEKSWSIAGSYERKLSHARMKLRSLYSKGPAENPDNFESDRPYDHHRDQPA
jgi:hypothetical protein